MNNNQEALYSGCPGCHIRCQLADPQCGRGLRIRESVLAGEEIPQRRGPGGPGGPGHPKRPGGLGGPGRRPGGPGFGPESDINQKLLFMLGGLVPREISQPERDEKINILSWLQRQEGCMTYRIMPDRARANAEELYGNLEQMLEFGWIEDRYSDWGTQYYYITEEGKTAIEKAEEQRRAAIAECFSVYSDEEKEQLVELLERLMRAPR